MLEKKIKVIIIILIFLIILIGVAGTVLYFTTDLLKPNDVLFKKYISQNIENIYYVLETSKAQENIDLLGSKDYTESTQASIKYLENSNDEEEIYDIKEQGIIKNSEGASYRDITANYGEQELLKIDLLEQNNIYGFRLSNLVQQFVSIENESISYLISSMGYEGQYFSETINKVSVSDLLNFSSEEIETLTNKYAEAIFSSISEDNYSSKRNVIITLANGQSVTTSSYTLTLTKNEFDKMYKRIINQAVNDEIILSKIEQIDAKIKEAGFNIPEGETLKQTFLNNLQNISNELDYSGEDTRQIAITVYESQGTTVRTLIHTEEQELIIDLDQTQGKTMSFKISELIDDQIDTKTVFLGKSENESSSTKSFSYYDSLQNIQISTNTINQENQMQISINALYTSDKITSLNIESNTEIKFEANEAIPVYFDEANNILLNDYDGDRIIGILNNLKNRAIESLENSQININTKLLNNIILYIDQREQKIAEEQQNNIELKKQRFNNQFILYEGEDVEYEYIQKLIQTVSRNMSDYQVVSGNQIRIMIEEGTENLEKANEIASVISNRYTYDVKINYSSEGYVETIDIFVHQDE